MDSAIKEQIARIERENRPLWSRMLRERFQRDVVLEIDWESFLAESWSARWRLDPLTIQTAGVERLLYAVTGLMDQKKKFRTAARDRIEVLLVTSARDVERVRLRYRKGRLTYWCFPGEWSGFLTIEKLQWELQGRVVGKNWFRKRVEGWMGRGPDRDEPEPTPGDSGPPGDHPDPTRDDPAPTEEDPEHQGPETAEEPQGDALRTQLESIYDRFLQAVREKDLKGLLGLVRISRTDEETLRREMSSDGFSGYSEWLLGAYPPLERTTFISLESRGEGLAGYYMAWRPSDSGDVLNLVLLTFLMGEGRWRMVFRTMGPPIGILQGPEDEGLPARAREAMAANPLLELERPETLADDDPRIMVPELSQGLSRLRAKLEAAYAAICRALRDGDLEAFLSAVILSEEDERRLRENAGKLIREIRESTPEPSDSIFVTLKTRGEDQAGLYFAAPYPHSPSFHFVYLKPFVRREGRWRMLFSLSLDLAMNMSVATSDGDLPSRGMEVINKIDLLKLEWVMSSLYEDLLLTPPGQETRSGS